MGRGETFKTDVLRGIYIPEVIVSVGMKYGVMSSPSLHTPWSPGSWLLAGSPLANLTRVRMLAPSADPGVKKINWTLFSATLSLTTSPDSGHGYQRYPIVPALEFANNDNS